MIILLNGHSLSVRDRFQAERIQVNIGERDSTATLTIKDQYLAVGDWVRYESGPGAGIVWRVKTIDDQVDRRTRTVQLEHAVQLLRDRIMFGEVKPTDISGSKNNPTAKQAVQYILGKQSDWTLGDFSYNVSNPYNFNGDDLFSALETVSSSLQDCIWEYDFSRYPFRIHIRRMDSAIASEMREDRNIRSLKRTIDRSRMYTRIYPIGKNNLHIDGEYLSKNENLYGTVSKVETDQSIGDKAQLKAWAQERLDRHCEPSVTVTISGLDLSRATGEPLDSFTIGKMCRAPLPEFGTNITERVKKLAYSDILSDPESVTVTLANELQDVAKILRDSASAGGRAARNGAKNAEEDHAWIVDTTDKVSLVAEAVAGKDQSGGANWSRVSELTVDGNGIDARVVKTEGEIVTHTTQIQMTEDAIKQEVKDRSHGDEELSGRIDVTAEDINIEVERAKDSENKLSGRIKVNSDKVSIVVEEKSGGYVVKAASIVTAINDEGSSVAIEADHVSITGNTKLSGCLTISDGSLVVKKSAVFQGNVDLTTSGSYIQAPKYNVKSGGDITFIGAQAGERYAISTDILKGMIKSAEVNGNTLTLTPFYGDPINFSKATPVSLTGSWSGRTFTVTESATGISYSESPTYDTGSGYSVQFDSITVDTFSSGHYAYARVLSSSQQGGNVLWGFKVDARGQYNNGWNYGQTQIARTERNATDQEITIKTLDYGQRWTIVDTYTKPNGTTSTIKYTVASKADRYDDNHNMFIGDTNSSPVTTRTINPNTSIDLWPGFLKSDGQTYQWGPKTTISAAKPTISMPDEQYVNTKAGLAYALGTSENNLVQFFSNRTSWPAGYYGFRITSGGANKYYYFKI